MDNKDFQDCRSEPYDCEFAGFILTPLCALAGETKPLTPGERTTVADADKGVVDLPAASADIFFLSQYIWRGYELSKSSLVIYLLYL